MPKAINPGAAGLAMASATIGISARTVQNHTLHIYEKLGVCTRAGAALLASRAGLVL